MIHTLQRLYHGMTQNLLAAWVICIAFAVLLVIVVDLAQQLWNKFKCLFTKAKKHSQLNTQPTPSESSQDCP